MPNWKEGDKVRIVTRTVTDDDRKRNTYYDHMAGLSGTVQNVFGEEEIAVKINPDALSKITKAVHEEATQRMRNKQEITEEQRKLLTQEELNFDANYVLLVKGSDLERV